VPILSPASYLEVIPNLLESATKSIPIEEQYIPGSQDQIGILLEAHPKMGTGSDSSRCLSPFWDGL